MTLKMLNLLYQKVMCIVVVNIEWLDFVFEETRGAPPLLKIY